MKAIEVATFSTEAEGVYWSKRLKQEGIPSVLVPLGGGLAVLGASAPIQHALRVREEDVDRARQLLRARELTRRRRRPKRH